MAKKKKAPRRFDPACEYGAADGEKGVWPTTVMNCRTAGDPSRYRVRPKDVRAFKCGYEAAWELLLADLDQAVPLAPIGTPVVMWLRDLFKDVERVDWLDDMDVIVEEDGLVAVTENAPRLADELNASAAERGPRSVRTPSTPVPSPEHIARMQRVRDLLGAANALDEELRDQINNAHFRDAAYNVSAVLTNAIHALESARQSAGISAAGQSA